MGFTQQVGEVGVIGTRVVKPGGELKFNNLKLQHDRLKDLVGEEVFCHDADGVVFISMPKYVPYRSTDVMQPRPLAGELLCRIDYLRGRNEGLQDSKSSD